MTVVWGIHNNQPAVDLVSGGFVAIGWDELGDLTAQHLDRDQLKARIAETYPSAKAGAIPVWAGVIWRFMHEMSEGDYVISPNKSDSTINIGQVAGDFFDAPDAEVHRCRRPVKWLKIGIPRATFSQPARNEIGSAVTMFKVKTHYAEFLAAIGAGPTSSTSDLITAIDEDEATELAVDEPSAERVETYSKDFVIDTLRWMDPYRFEHLVAAVLEAAGYRARVTQASGDGGVDVIAHRDPLGLEPPIIKVQCKRTVSTIGGPDVQKLTGALAHGGSEVGLFVTLGTFSTDAVAIERTRQDLRLINGAQLVEMILEYYEHLDPEWKRLLPMRSVYAIDRATEATT